MTATHIFLWTFFLSVLLIVLPCYAQITAPEQTVRLIYFLPKDSRPQPNINAKINTLTRDIQQFYASEMQRHGFGRKTFQLETNGRGNIIVHRVNGKFNDSYYQNQTIERVREEVKQRFDVSKNIYFVVIEISTGFLDSSELDHGEVCGRGGAIGTQGGFTLIPASDECFMGDFGFVTAVHELGHAFGLFHDFRSDAYLMSYGLNRTELSRCAVEWLDVHHYFNTARNTTNGGNALIQIQDIKASPADSIRFDFTVTDVDGIHQIQLHTPATTAATHEAPGDPHLIGCQHFEGQPNRINFESTVRLGTFEMTENTDFILQVIDVGGNFTRQGFQIDVTRYLTPTKTIFIPDENLATAVRKHLDLAADATITQHDMLQLIEFRSFVVEEPLKDLTGLEYAKNLKHFSNFYGQISDLTPLAGLTELRYLALVGCQVGDITPLKALTKLTWLDLYENNINDISPLANLTQLEILQMYENQISDLTPLTGLTQLRSLALEHNRIRDITPLAELKQLRTLLLGNNLNPASPNNNQIRDITPLIDLVNLEILYFSGNPVENYLPLLRLFERNPDLKTDIDLTQANLPILRKEDVNADGVINIQDLVRVASRFGQSAEGNSADVNGDSVINIQDLVLVASAFGGGAAAAPALQLQDIEGLTTADVQAFLTQARRMRPTDPVYMRGVLMLEQLLTRLRPKETTLLANYPNPFNPETWIPYQLAKDAEVTLTIYATDGYIVRRLALGHQPAGLYENRSRAAYWDGRNEFGERVASGVYFYTLTIGDFAATRRMLILK